MQWNLVQKQKVIFKINLASTVRCCCPHLTPVLTRTFVSQQSGKNNLYDTQKKSQAIINIFLISLERQIAFRVVFYTFQESTVTAVAIFISGSCLFHPLQILGEVASSCPCFFALGTSLALALFSQWSDRKQCILQPCCFLLLSFRAESLHADTCVVVLQVTQFATFASFIAVACVLGLWCLPSFQPFLLLLLFLSQMHVFCHTFLRTLQKSLL